MRANLIVILLWVGLVNITLGNTAPAQTVEAQAFFEAYGQTKEHYMSTYLLGMSVLAAALATVSLLLNMRSLCFLFMIFYSVLVLNVPYYIPTAFQTVFGFTILITGFVGLMWRLITWKRPSPKKPAQTDEPPQANTGV